MSLPSYGEMVTRPVVTPSQQNWVLAYLVNNYPDPHSVFAQLEGVDRQTAKELCYKIMYSSRFLREFKENM